MPEIQEQEQEQEQSPIADDEQQGVIVVVFDGRLEDAIEDDYDWIRGGC